MISDFKTTKRTLRTSNSNISIVSVNGCYYGTDNNPDKEDYYKYCGQEFWSFISGETDLYKRIIEPLGHKAKERNEEFLKSYSQILNRFTKEFTLEFCDNNGAIRWDKLVEHNSKKKKND